MNNDRDLLKQALSVLENRAPDHAVTKALRERLAQPEQEPRREWVGLTEEEMAELWENRGWYVTIFKAVEAKLKEKNNAD